MDISKCDAGITKKFYWFKKICYKNWYMCYLFYSILIWINDIHSLNLNQWTATDSQWLFTDGSSYKSFTENQWNSTDESVKASGGSNKISNIL